MDMIFYVTQQTIILVLSVFCLFVCCCCFLLVCFCCSYFMYSDVVKFRETSKERYLQANEEFQNRQGEDPKGLINADSILSLKY